MSGNLASLVAHNYSNESDVSHSLATAFAARRHQVHESVPTSSLESVTAADTDVKYDCRRRSSCL